MLFVAAIQIVDGAQGTAMGALRGYKDTRTPMLFAGLAYWGVGLPLAALLGFGLIGAPALGVYGFWTGTIASLAVAAVAFICPPCSGCRASRTGFVNWPCVKVHAVGVADAGRRLRAERPLAAAAPALRRRGGSA